MTLTVTQLRVEHRTDSLGIGVATPRLSWIVESDDTDVRAAVLRGHRR